MPRPLHPETAAPHPPRRLLIALLNLAASIHIAWFYVAYVPSGLNLLLYEQGRERTPFQPRILMMPLLRWAHGCTWLDRLADTLTAMPAWFPTGVRPEGIVQAAVALASIVVTGLAARRLYHAASPTGMLTPFVYPLTLVMVTATFCLNTMHRLRFVFDLPAMAFFAAGLSLIFFNRSRFLFAALFVVATVNRETTLFLLLFYLLKRWSDTRAHPPATRLAWKHLFDLRTTILLSSLGIFWITWHVSIDRRFAGNASAAGPRFWLNIGTLLWPTSWVQILCVFAFFAPLCIAGRNLIHDRTIHTWFYALPLWALFMLRFGILIEIRIFGELIPFFAVAAALITEQHLLQRIAAAGSSAAAAPPAPRAIACP